MNIMNIRSSQSFFNDDWKRFIQINIFCFNFWNIRFPFRWAFKSRTRSRESWFEKCQKFKKSSEYIKSIYNIWLLFIFWCIFILRDIFTFLFLSFVIFSNVSFDFYFNFWISSSFYRLFFWISDLFFQFWGRAFLFKYEQSVHQYFSLYKQELEYDV